MKLVKPSIENLDIATDPLKAIELAGRTCYKSEDKITVDSAERFVKMLLKRGHHAMIEHSNFILSVDPDIYEYIRHLPVRPYIRMSCDIGGNGCLISGNPRALRDFCLSPEVGSGIQRMIAVELSKKSLTLFEDVIRYTEHLAHLDTDALGKVDLFDNVKSLSTWERVLHDVMSYRIICDRGVTHEIVRHRPFSYAQESTRYVNYMDGVEFIIPPWIPVEPQEIVAEDTFTAEVHTTPDQDWLAAMGGAELEYKELIDKMWTPQQARSVLPNSLKTEIVVTGNLREWRHFFKLRCDKAAHPQMREVANMILTDIRERVPAIFDEVN